MAQSQKFENTIHSPDSLEDRQIMSEGFNDPYAGGSHIIVEDS